MIIRFIIYWLAFFIISTVSWINAHFGQPSTEQIIFQVALFKYAIGSAPSDFLTSFIQDCILQALDFALIISIIEKSLLIIMPSDFLIRAKRIIIPIPTSSLTKTQSEIGNDTIIYWTMKLGIRACVNNVHVCFLAFAIIYFGQAFAIPSYIMSQFKEDLLWMNYVAPENLKITAKNPKNLILIYMESTEETYRDAKIFGKNLLADLDNLNGTKFNKYPQLPGTGWTVAGIFATQCGMPIKGDFLIAQHICLTDILDQHGYHNVFMGGTSLEFTKKGELFKNHKFHELYGREEWLDKGLTNVSEWGQYDDDLFAQAKIRLKSLYEIGKPFNLTILTGDTHMPNGYISQYCHQKGVVDFNGVVKCSAEQVADFVKFVQENGYLRETNIIVIGDHLFPEDNRFNNLSKSERSIFNLFIAEKLPTKNREEIVHFDLLPTILRYIGFDFEGEQLALGKAAFLRKREDIK